MKWSIPLDKLAAKQKASVDTIARKATFALFNAVQQRSPVDTGRFRGNWQATQGALGVGTSNTTDPQGSIAGSEAMKALSFPVGDTVYFTNNLPYARRLEYGYSRQAPAGMVRLSVREFAAAVKASLR
jgi:hypothetical protein